MKLNLERLFKPKNPKPNHEREMLIRLQNKFEELNTLLSFEIVQDSGECVVCLRDNPGILPSEDLYRDAMEKLARKIVEENINATKIRKIFPSTEVGTKDILEKMDFHVFEIHPLDSKSVRFVMRSSGHEDGETLAVMYCKDFLQRFGKKSEEK